MPPARAPESVGHGQGVGSGGGAGQKWQPWGIFLLLRRRPPHRSTNGLLLMNVALLLVVMYGPYHGGCSSSNPWSNVFTLGSNKMWVMMAANESRPCQNFPSMKVTLQSNVCESLFFSSLLLREIAFRLLVRTFAFSAPPSTFFCLPPLIMSPA